MQILSIVYLERGNLVGAEGLLSVHRFPPRALCPPPPPPPKKKKKKNRMTHGSCLLVYYDVLSWNFPSVLFHTLGKNMLYVLDVDVFVF